MCDPRVIQYNIQGASVAKHGLGSLVARSSKWKEDCIQLILSQRPDRAGRPGKNRLLMYDAKARVLEASTPKLRLW